MNYSVEQRFNEVSSIAENICNALRNEVFQMGLPVNFINPQAEGAEYSLQKDPASGLDSLVGVWRDHKGQKKGEILFHADGSFYAEFDVICEHPGKTKYFVEAVTAWGRGDQIKSEPRLLLAV